MRLAEDLTGSLASVAGGGERVAALDGVAKEAAHEAVLGLEPPEDRDTGHADRMDREHERELQRTRGTGVSINRGMNSTGTTT